MDHQRIRFILKEASQLRFWICIFRFFRGLRRTWKGDYSGAISDFKYILDKGGLILCESLIYEDLGTAYALDKDFKKAQNALLKALELKRRRIQPSELFRWLGYVNMRLEHDEEALEYFKTAFECAKEDKYKWGSWFGDEYIEKCVAFINNRIHEKYKRILPTEGCDDLE